MIPSPAAALAVLRVHRWVAGFRFSLPALSPSLFLSNAPLDLGCLPERQPMKRIIAMLALAAGSLGLVAACVPDASPGQCFGDCVQVPEGDRPGNIPGNGPDHTAPPEVCTPDKAGSFCR